MRFDFAQHLINWYAFHGRKNLPWQRDITPYKVWVSEIMLQQTQVATVIPYFERFMTSFPTVEKLANAPLEKVLNHWSGLGYYARARNLHKTAQIIATDLKGDFPDDVDTLQTLPGIGKSTAGAICSLAFQKKEPILDGNVQRVFSRFYALENNPVLKLWELAYKNLPASHNREYNQSLMDLGAIICTRKNPQCMICPLKIKCRALKEGVVDQYPTSNKKRPIPTKQTYFLIIENQRHEILLERRPPVGIWGGLWCFPECDTKKGVKPLCLERFGLETYFGQKKFERLDHTFTHFHLKIYPLLLKVKSSPTRMMEPSSQAWYNLNQTKSLGIPKPVIHFLKQLES